MTSSVAAHYSYTNARLYAFNNISSRQSYNYQFSVFTTVRGSNVLRPLSDLLRLTCMVGTKGMSLARVAQ